MILVFELDCINIADNVLDGIFIIKFYASLVDITQGQSAHDDVFM